MEKSPYKNCNCTYPYLLSCSGGFHEVACKNNEIPESVRMDLIEAEIKELRKKCCEYWWIKVCKLCGEES